MKKTEEDPIYSLCRRV